MIILYFIFFLYHQKSTYILLHNLEDTSIFSGFEERANRNISSKAKYGECVILTFFLMYSLVSAGIASQRCWYWNFISGSLEVSWFLSCKPAAMRAMGLAPTVNSTALSRCTNSCCNTHGNGAIRRSIAYCRTVVDHTSRLYSRD